MGAVVTFVATAVATALTHILTQVLTEKARPNPTLEKVEEMANDNVDPAVRTAWGNREEPILWPTLQEIEHAKTMARDPNGSYFHFGVAGVVKSGKSSLLNSFRSLRSNDAGAATVGVAETTMRVTRYDDPRTRYPFAWYDIPGAGTHTFPSTTYFNSQGLFILDCIMVIVKDSCQEHDASLIRQCQKLNIPTYVVRSQSDSAVRNLLFDQGEEEEGPNAVASAKREYIDRATENIHEGIRNFGLKPMRVYLINARSMLRFMKDHRGQDLFAIDEQQLVLDILQECHAKRVRPTTD